MELTLDEALNKGIEAHKAGKAQEADSYYTAILKANPKHPDANHNMGVLGVDVGQIEAALPFFEIALEANPKIAQYWLSYIDALIRLNRMTDAKSVFDKAKSNGAKGDGLEQIEKRIASSNSEKSNRQKPTQEELNPLMKLYNQNRLQQVFKETQKLTKRYTKSLTLWNLMGASAAQIGKLDEAVTAFQKALLIKPDDAQAHYNLGNVFQNQGRLEEAMETYKKALSIKPDYAEAFNNLGNALKQQGKLEEAIEAYNKAISIKPDYADAFNNMGNALKQQGKLEEAIESYSKAIYIKPDYAEAYWNISGTTDSIIEAKNYIEQCLEADPNHLRALLTLSALEFYEGDKSKFKEVIKSTQKNHPFTRSFAWAFSLPKLPPLHFHRWALFDHMTDLSKKNRPFYEFGVWRGEAFRYLIKTFKKGYGFDTFEGLPEDWHNKKAGTYTSDGNIPKIKGGKFIVGKFEDTLPDFFAEERPKASLINFDADLHSSTICALNHAKPVIDKHTILIFDEFIINKNWEQDEYKALEEFCTNNHYSYEVLAISFFTKQVAVKIVGI